MFVEWKYLHYDFSFSQSRLMKRTEMSRENEKQEINSWCLLLVIFPDIFQSEAGGMKKTNSRVV